MARVKLIIAVGLALAALTVTAVSADTPYYSVSERWPEDTFTFVYNPEFAPEGVDETAIEASFEKLNGLAGITVVYGGRTDTWPDTAEGQNVIGWANFGPAASSGVAVRTPNDCDIYLNVSEYVTPLLVLHELGHCLGLDHNDDASIMNLAAWGYYNLPTYMDIGALRELYGWPYSVGIGELAR